MVCNQSSRHHMVLTKCCMHSWGRNARAGMGAGMVIERRGGYRVWLIENKGKQRPPVLIFFTIFIT